MDEDARVLLTALGLGQKAAARSADGGLRALRLASANRALAERVEQLEAAIATAAEALVAVADVTPGPGARR